MRKLFTLMLFVILAGFAGMGTAQAGCTVQGWSAAGELVVLELPCDFPIQGDTGNPEADAAAYASALTSWGADHPTEYDVLTALTTITNYNISQSSFNGMSAERKASIQAKPDYYIVMAD